MKPCKKCGIIAIYDKDFCDECNSDNVVGPDDCDLCLCLNCNHQFRVIEDKQKYGWNLCDNCFNMGEEDK